MAACSVCVDVSNLRKTVPEEKEKTVNTPTSELVGKTRTTMLRTLRDINGPSGSTVTPLASCIGRQFQLKLKSLSSAAVSGVSVALQVVFTNRKNEPL